MGSENGCEILQRDCGLSGVHKERMFGADFLGWCWLVSDGTKSTKESKKIWEMLRQEPYFESFRIMVRFFFYCRHFCNRLATLSVLFFALLYISAQPQINFNHADGEVKAGVKETLSSVEGFRTAD